MRKAYRKNDKIMTKFLSVEEDAISMPSVDFSASLSSCVFFNCLTEFFAIFFAKSKNYTF